MTAPKSDFVTAPQHHFSETRWSQHSETAVKVQGLYSEVTRLVGADVQH